MNAAQIIDEIKHLSPGEQAQVALFVRQLEERQWTGTELSDAAVAMTAEKDPAKAGAAWERIVVGFYGKATDA
jgi:hypothetical protein